MDELKREIVWTESAKFDLEINNKIMIYRVFDCRQNPEKLKFI